MPVSLYTISDSLLNNYRNDRRYVIWGIHLVVEWKISEINKL
jgi:hypothetical protein